MKFGRFHHYGVRSRTGYTSDGGPHVPPLFLIGMPWLRIGGGQALFAVSGRSKRRPLKSRPRPSLLKMKDLHRRPSFIPCPLYHSHCPASIVYFAWAKPSIRAERAVPTEGYGSAGFPAALKSAIFWRAVWPMLLAGRKRLCYTDGKRRSSAADFVENRK